MASVGPNYAGAATTVPDPAFPTFDYYWSNLTGAIGGPLDSNWASASTSGYHGQPTAFLVSSGYGFAISNYATIDGIFAEIFINAPDNTGGSSFAVERTIRLMKIAPNPVGSNKSTSTFIPQSVETNMSYGGPTDKWGTTWTPADINSPNFGFLYQAGPGSGDNFCFVDAIRLTVYYTDHAAPSSPRRRMML